MGSGRTAAVVSALIGLSLLALPATAQSPDHLKCYKMKDPLKLAGTADLDTPQFGLDPGCKLSGAKLFCVPATKTNVAATDKSTKQPIMPLPVGGSDPGDRICYKVTCAQVVPDQEVTDQFGSRTIGRLKATMVCTPAMKGSPPPTTSTSTTTTTSIASSSTTTTTSPPGLILHYPLDNGGTNTGYLGAAYNGVVTGAASVAGKFNNALAFSNSTTNGLKVSNSHVPLSVSPHYTVSLWFREDVPGVAGASLIDFRNAGSPGGGVAVGHGIASPASIVACATGTSGTTACNSFVTPSFGLWHNLVLRYAGTSTGAGGGAPVDVYLDGVVVAAIPNPTLEVIFSSTQRNDLVIGQSSMFYVDEIRVYDQVFTAAEQCITVIGGTWNPSTSMCILP